MFEESIDWRKLLEGRRTEMKMKMKVLAGGGGWRVFRLFFFLNFYNF